MEPASRSARPARGDASDERECADVPRATQRRGAQRSGAERARRNARRPAEAAPTTSATASAFSRLPSLLGERAMDELHADRAFADGRGDALDAARAHVADGEDAVAAGLEAGTAGARAASWRAASSSRVTSVPVLTKPLSSSATQPSSQPVLGSAPVMRKTWRICARLDAAVAAAPAHALEVLVALEADDLAVRPERDVRVLLDAADEVARHRLGEAGAAHEHVDVLGLRRRGRPPPARRSWRRRRRRPPRRRTAAPRWRSRRSRRRRPRSARRSGSVEPAVLHAAGDDDRARAHRARRSTRSSA